jgi:hypothetical protein
MRVAVFGAGNMGRGSGTRAVAGGVAADASKHGVP